MKTLIDQLYLVHNNMGSANYKKGYLIDEAYWGKGIVTKATKLLEKRGFEELGLKRIEILMNPKNIGSEKVAIKCGYIKEGTKQKTIKNGEKYSDAHLYAKILK